MLKRLCVSFAEPPFWNDNVMPPGAGKKISNADDMKTLLGQESLAKAFCGKFSVTPLKESDSENRNPYGDSDKAKDGKKDTDNGGPLYSYFYD